MDGLLLLDKPSGITSNLALQLVKRAIGAKKAGHTGALDPLASGMLPLCFGEATKFSQFLLDANKCYQVTAQLGVTTDTGDSDGQVTAEHTVPQLNESDLDYVLEQFRGDIQQIPPMYSALKHQGRPLYQLAREGQTIDRAARPVKIFQLFLSDYRHQQLQLRVVCSKGTYIRSLVEDIGRSLGCGAHVTRLHREYCEPFADCPMLDLQQVKQQPEQAIAALLPVDAAIEHLPKLQLTSQQTSAIRHGQPLALSLSPVTPLWRVYDPANQFIGLGQSNAEGLLAAKRLLAFNEKTLV